MQALFRVLALQVVDADPAVLRSIAPCLRSPALRQFVKSFTHESQFTDWADNPRVIAMLQQALRLLQHGHITEQELEHALVSQMKVNLKTMWACHLVSK